MSPQLQLVDVQCPEYLKYTLVEDEGSWSHIVTLPGGTIEQIRRVVPDRNVTAGVGGQAVLVANIGAPKRFSSKDRALSAMKGLVLIEVVSAGGSVASKISGAGAIDTPVAPRDR